MLSLLHSVNSVILICVYICPYGNFLFHASRTTCYFGKLIIIQSTDYCVMMQLYEYAVLANCVHHCVHPLLYILAF